MSDRIVLRVGESLVAGGPPGTAAEPEVAIGEMDGPFGSAFANLLGDQVKGHSRVLALLNTDVMVRPPTLCVSKVTVDNERYTNVLMGTVQYATAMGRTPIPSVPATSRRTRPTSLRHHRVGLAEPRHRGCGEFRSPDPVRHSPEGDYTGHSERRRSSPRSTGFCENQDKVVHKYFEKGEGRVARTTLARFEEIEPPPGFPCGGFSAMPFLGSVRQAS